MPPATEPEAQEKRNPIESSSKSAAKTSNESGKNLQPDYSASIEFLRRFHPNRNWILTAISLDKKSLPTATFTEAQSAECLAWLEKHGAQHNLYFSVGEVPKGVAKKAERTDISNVWWLHVDVDPRATEELAPEQARILKLLREPPNLPPPTVIVNSGGGCQSFWQLREPIVTDCKLEAAEEAALYNQKIEWLLGADSCHDISRIMRLPGTVNRPDDKKLAKGRKLARAEVVEWHGERIYDIGQFEKAARPQSANGPERVKAQVSGNVRRIASVDELPAGVSGKARVVICQGFDPDEPNKFQGRSEWLFYACCEMVRGGCSDEQIYAVITDPGFRISDSVLDKGSMVHKYALRQIERARGEYDDSPVARINRRHFAILEGKRIVFYHEEDDKSITAMNGEAFSFATATIKFQKTVTNAAGKEFTKEFPAEVIWRSDPKRRFYRRGFVLDPKYAETDEEYNLWKGFGVDPAQGDWSALREHIVTVLAGGNADYADYILKWAAWSFQNPATPPRVALVFRGEEGTGKGVFGRALVTAFGSHGQRVQNINHVAGRFNSHMRHCCMFFADEVSLVNKEQEGNLKGMITEPTLPIEAKGVDIVHAENHLHVVMASNNEFVVPAGIGARRFAMFDVLPMRKGDAAYWDRLYAEIDNGGIGAMLHDLLALDLGKWHPEAARPDTAALDEQKIQSLPPLPQYWLNCLQSGTIGFGTLEKGRVAIPTMAFLDMLNQKLGLKDKHQITSSRLGHFFLKFGFEKVERNPRGWIVPPLAEARAAWAREWTSNLKVKVAWGDEKEWQVAVPCYSGF